MAKRKTKVGIVLVILLVAAGGGALAAVIGWGPAAGLWSSATTGSAASPTSSDYAGSGDDAGSGGAGSAAVVTGQRLTLSGSVSGTITTASEVSCTVVPDSRTFAWRLVGSLNGSRLGVSFNSNHYRGPYTYNATGISDADGGLITMEVGEGADLFTLASNGASQGTFTVAADQRSGSIDAEMSDRASGREVRVSGTWRCA